MYAEVNDIRMYYEEMGDPAATPLILLHGASGAIDAPESGWANLMPSFAERYRVLTRGARLQLIEGDVQVLRDVDRGDEATEGIESVRRRVEADARWQPLLQHGAQLRLVGQPGGRVLPAASGAGVPRLSVRLTLRVALRSACLSLRVSRRAAAMRPRRWTAMSAPLRGDNRRSDGKQDDGDRCGCAHGPPPGSSSILP